MAEVTGIKMTPVDGGDGVEIPSGKTTIGRGTFLQVWYHLLMFCVIYNVDLIHLITCSGVATIF